MDARKMRFSAQLDIIAEGCYLAAFTGLQGVRRVHLEGRTQNGIPRWYSGRPALGNRMTLESS